MRLRTAHRRRKRALRNTPMRRWLRAVGKALAVAMGCPTRPWFRLQMRDDPPWDGSRYSK